LEFGCHLNKAWAKCVKNTKSLELELGNDREDGDDINIRRMSVRTSHTCRPTKEEAFT